MGCTDTQLEIDEFLEALLQKDVMGAPSSKGPLGGGHEALGVAPMLAMQPLVVTQFLPETKLELGTITPPRRRSVDLTDPTTPKTPNHHPLRSYTMPHDLSPQLSLVETS